MLVLFCKIAESFFIKHYLPKKHRLKSSEKMNHTPNSTIFAFYLPLIFSAAGISIKKTDVEKGGVRNMRAKKKRLS